MLCPARQVAEAHDLVLTALQPAFLGYSFKYVGLCKQEFRRQSHSQADGCQKWPVCRVCAQLLNILLSRAVCAVNLAPSEA